VSPQRERIVPPSVTRSVPTPYAQKQTGPEGPFWNLVAGSATTFTELFCAISAGVFGLSAGTKLLGPGPGTWDSVLADDHVRFRGNSGHGWEVPRCPPLTQSGHNELTGSAELSANRALSVRADKLHPVEATAAEPSVTERYQCQAETQSRGGRKGIKKSVVKFRSCWFGHCTHLCLLRGAPNMVSVDRAAGTTSANRPPFGSETGALIFLNQKALIVSLIEINLRQFRFVVTFARVRAWYDGVLKCAITVSTTSNRGPQKLATS